MKPRKQNHNYRGGLAKYYKVLQHDGTGPFSGAPFSLPIMGAFWKEVTTPGQWMTVIGEMRVCNNGLHVTTPKKILHWYRKPNGHRVFAVGLPPVPERLRCGGMSTDKAVFRTIRLVREVLPNSKEWVKLGLPVIADAK